MPRDEKLDETLWKRILGRLTHFIRGNSHSKAMTGQSPPIQWRPLCSIWWQLNRTMGSRENINNLRFSYSYRSFWHKQHLATVASNNSTLLASKFELRVRLMPLIESSPLYIMLICGQNYTVTIDNRHKQSHQTLKKGHCCLASPLLHTTHCCTCCSGIAINHIHNTYSHSTRTDNLVQ